MALNGTVLEEKETLEKEMVHMAKKSVAKKRFIRTVIVFLLIIVAAGAAWFYGQKQAKIRISEQIAALNAEISQQKEQIEKLKEEPIVVSPIAPRIDLDIIDSEIKNIGELATVEYLYTDASEFSDSKQIKNWNIPLTKKSFILRWSGTIKAGINFEEISASVDEEAKVITVNVPAAEILSYSVDNDSVQLLSEKDNIFNHISIEDKNDFDAKTEEAMTKRAIENGILDKAQKNAEDIISRLILSLPGSDSYTIEFKVK